jgi:hypothetical protein
MFPFPGFVKRAASREILTAARTYYVRTDGSDSNTGLVDSAGGAFLTIPKAVAVIIGDLDLGGQEVAIDVGNGTYTDPVSITGWVGGGSVTITGDTTTPANVVVNVTGDCFTFNGALPGVFKIEGVKMVATSFLVNHLGVGLVQLGANEYGTCVVGMFAQTNGATIEVTANYTISGACTFHWAGYFNGYISLTGIQITITGTPAITIFASVVRTGLLFVNTCTFVGTFTGQRYDVSRNGVLDTNGAGVNHIPGTIAGATATGGQYT